MTRVLIWFTVCVLLRITYMIQSECFVFPFFRFRQRFLLSPKCSSKDIHSRLDLSALNQCVGVCVYECVYWNVFQFEPFRLADAVAQRRTLKIKNSKICTRNTWDKGACDERCSFIIYNLRSSRINRSLIFFVAHLLMIFFLFVAYEYVTKHNHTSIFFSFVLYLLAFYPLISLDSSFYVMLLGYYTHFVFLLRGSTIHILSYLRISARISVCVLFSQIFFNFVRSLQRRFLSLFLVAHTFHW